MNYGDSNETLFLYYCVIAERSECSERSVPFFLKREKYIYLHLNYFADSTYFVSHFWMNINY